jgi:hypothetical protein
MKNNRQNSAIERFILEKKNEIRMDSQSKEGRQSFFEHNRRLTMEKKTPPNMLGKTSPKNKRDLEKLSPLGKKTSRQTLQITPSKEGIFADAFVLKFNMAKQKDNEGLEQNKNITNNKTDNLMLPEILDEEKAINDFLLKQPELICNSLDLRKIEESKLFILTSKHFNRMAGLLKGLLDKIWKRDSIVEISTFTGDTEMLVISVREPKKKSRKTILSSVQQDYIYDKEDDVWGALEFLYSKIVLSLFYDEKKKIGTD